MNLISGATGFLGSYILKLLVDKGEKVIALKRKNSSLHLLGAYEDKVTWIEGDVNDIPSLEEAMKGCEYVYHCAATISLSNSERELMYKVNVEGTANMVNIAIHHKVKKFVHISSVSAMPAIEDRLIDESSIWYTNPYPSSYGLTKFLAEREVQRGIAEGLNAVLLCPSSILGRCNWNGGTGLFFTNVYKGLPFYTEGIGGFVDARDVAEIAIRCMHNDQTNNDKFIVSARNMSYQELFILISESMNKRPPNYRLNYLIGVLAIFLDFMTSSITKSERMVTKEALEMAKIKTNYDNTKIKKLLDYEFLTIEQTIKETTLAFLKDAK